MEMHPRGSFEPSTMIVVNASSISTRVVQEAQVGEEPQDVQKSQEKREEEVVEERQAPHEEI